MVRYPGRTRLQASGTPAGQQVPRNHLGPLERSHVRHPRLWAHLGHGQSVLDNAVPNPLRHGPLLAIIIAGGHLENETQRERKKRTPHIACLFVLLIYICYTPHTPSLLFYFSSPDSLLARKGKPRTRAPFTAENGCSYWMMEKGSTR